MFEIFNETKTDIPELKEVKKYTEYIVEKENLTKAEFNIIIVDNVKIKEINKEYRGLDKVTDVISFALEDDETFVENERTLGDIYISIDKAKEQADEYGHSQLRELSFLVTHGILHLLGYDHMIESDEKIMFKRQEELLDGYGITR